MMKQLFSEPTVINGYSDKDSFTVKLSKVAALILVLLLILPLFGMGQSIIRGVVLSGDSEGSQQQPVSFANILLLNPTDSTLVKGGVSDVEGFYQLDHIVPSAYLLQVTMIGFDQSIISVSISEGINELPTTILNESVTALNEVVVKAQKPLYEKEIDKTVVNVKSSVTSSGQSVLDILGKSPGVVVNKQTKSIAMSGNTGVLVMINGKVSRMPADAVVQMLDGLSAANVEKIELITSPPAKYEAEGNGGIINIVMRRSAEIGTNGNWGLTMGRNDGLTYGGNFSLNHRSKRAGYFLNYSLNNDRNTHFLNNQRQIPGDDFTQTVESSSIRNPQIIVQNIQGGMEYDITDKTLFSFNFTGYKRMWEQEANTSTDYQFSPDSAANINMDLTEANIWKSGSFGLGLTRHLSKNSLLDFSLDYLRYQNDNPSAYDITTSDMENEAVMAYDKIAVNKSTPINFKVAKIDYNSKINDHLSIDLGGKYTVSHFNNDVRVQRMIDGTMTSDADLTNNVSLDETISAGYASFNWNVNDQWKINAGLRYEYSNTNLSSVEEENLVDRQSGNFFPSLFVAYQLGEESKLQFSYNKRITRPTFNDLAPFVFFVDPTSFIGGNVDLKPTITDGIDLNYQLKQWWVSLKYSFSRDYIAAFQPEYTEDNQQIMRAQNLNYLQNIGISVSLPFEITSWWNVQGDLTYFRHYFETSHLEDNLTGNANSLSVNVVNNFILPKNYAIELKGLYQSGQIWGVHSFVPTGQIDLGIRKNLKNEGGTITLVFTDILATSMMSLHSTDPTTKIASQLQYDWNVRSVNLTYSRRFGAKKLKAMKFKKGASEERNRISQ